MKIDSFLSIFADVHLEFAIRVIIVRIILLNSAHQPLQLGPEGWKECQGDCCRPGIANTDWDKRIADCVKSEKGVFQKFADIQSIEMQKEQQRGSTTDPPQ